MTDDARGEASWRFPAADEPPSPWCDSAERLGWGHTLYGQASHREVACTPNPVRRKQGSRKQAGLSIAATGTALGSVGRHSGSAAKGGAPDACVTLTAHGAERTRGPSKADEISWSPGHVSSTLLGQLAFCASVQHHPASMRRRSGASLRNWLKVVFAAAAIMAPNKASAEPTPAGLPGARPPAESSAATTPTIDRHPSPNAIPRPDPPVDNAEGPSSPDDVQPARPNLWLTGAELVVGLGAGAIWYVIDDRNVLDWDKPSLKERFNGEAWRFDNNGFAINFIFHPLSGAAFHMVARSNGLTFWPAAATSALGSTLWEYVIEFNEKVSINDMLVTPGGGMLLGEFAHKLGAYINDVPALTPTDELIRWSLGPTVALNRTLNGVVPPPDAPRDENGFSALQWHQFATHVDWRWLKGPERGRKMVQRLGFGGTLVSLKGYRQPANLTRWFSQGEISRLDLELTRADGTIHGDLFTETLLAGLHHQALAGSRATPDGVAITAATAMGYRYRNSSAQGFDDRQGVLHFPGPAIDLYARSGRLAAEFSGRLSVDFAGISTLASRDWFAAHDATANDTEIRVKTTVQREGYFYGWGLSASSHMRLWAGPFWAEVRIASHQYDSVEGLDRAQERVSSDIDLDEIAREYAQSVGVMPANWVGIALSRGVNHRLSYAGAHSTSVRVEELGLSVQVNY